MIIGGLQKTTLIDYPGKIACTIFLSGCNFRCPWCYSGELVLPEKIIKQPRITEQDFFNFLKERQGLLDGVVICGGEPTINKNLPEFIEKIKKMNFLVKLDTNGSNSKMLEELIDKKLIDYVAMDIKSPIDKPIYKDIMLEKSDLEEIKKSIDILKKNKIGFEFRTTVVPEIHEKEDFLKIAKLIGGPNIKYYLQNFRAEKTIDPKFEKVKPFPNEFLGEIIKEISPYFKVCQLR